MLLTSSSDLQAYQNSPELPLWQSLAWKTYQESLGRSVRLYGLRNGSGKITSSALVVIDRTTFGLSTWDIPRGPLWHDEKSLHVLMNEIIEDAKKDNCMTITFSPTNSVAEDRDLPLQGKISLRHEQPDATIIIDLIQSDADILAQMKPKGRYNINVAKKHGVTIEASQDIDVLYQLLMNTGKRDAFGIHSKTHYVHFLNDLDGSFLLLARDAQKKPLAGLLGVIYGEIGIYYYGASDYAERASMAPYLLQWEAMQYCKNHGCTKYDLFGIAPSDDVKHPWYGVTRFKKQFSGEVMLYPPEQEIILKPVAKSLIGWKRRVWGKAF